MTASSSQAPAVVIGAGPYGLSAAAHLRARGIPVRIFGEVMTSWRHHMPVGMCLKSTPKASSISAPAPGYALADFCAHSGVPVLREDQVVPVDLFIRYGEWFAERLVPGVESGQVCQLDLAGGDNRRFRVTLGSGEDIETASVVIASGLTGCAYLPPELADAAPDGPAPAGLVSHSSQHHDLSGFAGQEVAVIGAGQSALENAALLHEAGASVQVLARGAVRFGDPPREPASGPMSLLPTPASPLGPTWKLYPFSHAPGAFRYLPRDTRLTLVKRVLGPLGAWWLKDRVVGQFPVRGGQRIRHARASGDKVVLAVASAGGGESDVKIDHVVAATGYRVNLEGLGFLSPEVLARLDRVAGSPRLSASFESTVPGMFFTGMAGAVTFGPLMRFVCGTGFASRRVSAAVAARTIRTRRP